MRLCGWPFAIAVRVALRYANGSTPLILQVSISDAMRTQAIPPSSCPAKRQFFRLSAIGADQVFSSVGVDLDAAVMQECLQCIPVIVDVGQDVYLCFMEQMISHLKS